MEKATRIPQAHWLTQIGVPILFLIILGAILGNIMGESVFRLLLTLVMFSAAGIHVIIFLRMKNTVYLIPMLFYLTAGLTLAFAANGQSTIVLVLAGAAILMFLLLMFTLITGRLKWRYREVMELAARKVTGTENGFTSRPLAAGSVTTDLGELRKYARFLLKYGIVYPYDEGQRLVFVVSGSMFSRLFGINRSYVDETWVAFAQDGEVTVNIAKQDYEEYTDKLTFDQLCASFGDLFEEFYDLHREGRGKEIITRMRELKFMV